MFGGVLRTLADGRVSRLTLHQHLTGLIKVDEVLAEALQESCE